jgi:hypothetical protein
MVAINSECLSKLLDALQQAVLLATVQRAAAQTQAADADQLYDALSRAVDATHQLRMRGAKEV